MGEYSFTIKWTNFDGSVETVTAKGNTLENAKSNCLKLATEFGWKQPRWWQWWRWHDTRVNNSIID